MNTIKTTQALLCLCLAVGCLGPTDSTSISEASESTSNQNDNTDFDEQSGNGIDGDGLDTEQNDNNGENGTNPTDTGTETGTEDDNENDPGTFPVLQDDMPLSDAPAQFYNNERRADSGSLFETLEVDGDDLPDLLIGEKGVDHNSLNTAGRVVIFLGKNHDFSQGSFNTNGADIKLYGDEDHQQLGQGVHNLGDLDGDGKDELGFIFFRKLLIFWGNTLAVGGTFEVGNADLIITRDSTSTSLSEKITSVQNMGDLNADGMDDLLVAAGGYPSRAMALLSGNDLQEGGQVDFNSSLSLWEHNDASPAALLNIGDINAGGKNDFLVGLPTAWSSTPGSINDAGQVLLFLGENISFSTQDFSTADAVFTGANENDEIGTRLLSAGDIDGDGLNDILLVSPERDRCSSSSCRREGAIHVVLADNLPLSGTVMLNSVTHRTIIGDAQDDKIGTFVSAVGDVDGDQKGDLLIGNPQAVTVAAGNLDFDQGKAVLMSGHTLLNHSTATLSWNTGTSYFAENDGDEAGPVAGVGDLNGDNKPDFMIGAPEAEGPNEEGGVSYLFFGE
ncbi:MAG: hypothetical protein CMH56_07865 [Myxococcales bacterium]|nr:hypothetical protein [Myxococcales bacterium]|tara:strand:- start:621 stop:2303 length:1683 start_codon:yes stop_codon:yes gene_type:complete